MGRRPGTATDPDEDGGDLPLPRETTALFGHGGAEEAVLRILRSGRVPHAILIGGERGIGKATFAYRIARFVLANPAAPQRDAAASLALAADHRTVRRVKACAHPDLLVLERTADEKTGRLRTVISVDQVRRLSGFFGATAGEGGWRVCIVDSADELKFPEGANALLKMLEEPPARSLFLLVSHAPGRLLPTIRSRCRQLTLRPVPQEEVVRAAALALGREAGDPALAAAAAASRGSVALAIALAGGPMLTLREKVTELLNALPATDPRALHALGDTLERDRALLPVFVDAVRDWLSARLGAGGGDLAGLRHTADMWELLERASREVETYNLERKPLVFSLFDQFGHAVRG